METALVVACVTAAVSVFGALVTLAVALSNAPKVREQARRDAETAIEAMRAELTRELRTHEARLRIAAEGRLQILQRQMDSSMALRDHVWKIAASLHNLAFLVQEHGVSDEAKTARSECYAALRSVGIGSGFVTPELARETENLLMSLQDVLGEILATAGMQQRAERIARLQQVDAKAAAVAARSREIFGNWQRDLLHSHERWLALVEPIE